MMSGSHPKCEALTWTRKKKKKMSFPSTLLPGLVWLGGLTSSFQSTHPREPLTSQMWPQTQG